MLRQLLLVLCLVGLTAPLGTSFAAEDPSKTSTRNPPLLVTSIADPSRLQEFESEIKDYSNWLIRFYRRTQHDLTGPEALAIHFLAALGEKVMSANVPVELRELYLSQFGDLAVAFYNAEAEKSVEVKALSVLFKSSNGEVRFADVLIYALGVNELNPAAEEISSKFCEFLENYALSSVAGLELVVQMIERHHFAPAVGILERMVLNEGEPTRKLPARAALIRLALASNNEPLERVIVGIAGEHLRLSCQLHVALFGKRSN